MAQRVSVGKVVLLGLLAGGLFGVVQGLLRDNGWVGLGTGVFFGLGMAVVMRRLWGSTAMRGLSRQQRRVVSRAIRRGEPVEDPQLARPLVDQADAVLATPHPVQASRVLMALFGLFGLLVVVVEFRDGGVAAVGSGVLLVVFSLVMLFVVIPWSGRQRERCGQAREATRRRHQLSEVD